MLADKWKAGVEGSSIFWGRRFGDPRNLKNKLCGRSGHMRDLFTKCSATRPAAAGQAELLVNKPSQWT